jgi:hypothetical protein
MRVASESRSVHALMQAAASGMARCRVMVRAEVRTTVCGLVSNDQTHIMNATRQTEMN